ncbi:hypothetical protein Tco_0736652 [Tanacetum coccineum]
MPMWIISRGVVLLILLMEYKVLRDFLLHRSSINNSARLSNKFGGFYFSFKLGITGLLHHVITTIADRIRDKDTSQSKQNLQSSSMTFIPKTLIIPSVLDSCFISSTVSEVKRVVRLGINPMIQPEPEDLPKDNPKLEIAVLRQSTSDLSNTLIGTLLQDLKDDLDDLQRTQEEDGEVEIVYPQFMLGSLLSEGLGPEMLGGTIGLEVKLVKGHVFPSIVKVKMDDPNIIMEEYIRLEEEKACRRGKVYNWETATYGKIWYDEDVHDLRSIETEFPAIVFNDSLTSEVTLTCEPTVSPLNDNKIDLRISFDESNDEDYMVIYDKNSLSYKIISANDLKTDSENNNEKVNMPSFPSPEPTVSYFDDLDFFKDFENEFPAIVYNDALTSKSDSSTEPVEISHRINEFDLKNETSLSKCDEEEQNVLYFNDLFPFNLIYHDDSKSDKDNDDDKINIKQSSRGNVINIDDDAYAQRKHFKTLSLDESRSPDFDDQEGYSKEEDAEIMAETMEQYMSKTRANYGSGVARPKIEDKDNFELKG